MPPKGIEPYDIPFLKNMGYSAKCLSSLIVNTSTKGHTLVEENSSALGFSQNFVIKKSDLNKEELNNIEKIVLASLFTSGLSSIECSNDNHREFNNAKNLIATALKNKLGKFYKKNSAYILPGLFLNILGIFLAFSYANPKLTSSVFAISFISSFIFILIIKRYSERGRSLLDEIDGYKLYLSLIHI